MISECISVNIPTQMKILNMVIPILMHFFKLELCKLHKTARHPTKCDVINNVKIFPTVYGRIYCCKFLTLSNQMSHNKSKCIRIVVYRFYCMVLFHSQTQHHNDKAIFFSSLISSLLVYVIYIYI